MGSIGRRWWIRGGAGAVAVTVAAVVCFQVARPRVEALVTRRLEAAASRRGWRARVGVVHLTPRLSLDLRDLVVEDASHWRVQAAEAQVEPAFSWRGLTGRAASLRLSRTSVSLPGGLQVDVQPSSWAVDALGDGLRLELAARGQALGLTLSNKDGHLRVDAHATRARLTELVQVSRSGCAFARLGTVDGEGRLERSGQGPVEIQLRGRASGVAIAPLSVDTSPACAADRFGAPVDADIDIHAAVEPAAGWGRITRLAISTAGIQVSATLNVEGWAADPRIALDLAIPRMDLARVLATAGLDLPASDLGAAALSYHVDGRLLAPESLTVAQRLDFTPPGQPLPVIERLKGRFVHRVETSDGATRAIDVSPESPDFIGLSEVPPLFIRTLLLAEDTDFYGHHGVDLRELPTALATNLGRGTFVRGASTIPQQLAKNLFLTRRKTLSRKVEEAALALLLDSALGKQRMLEIYLNVIEWGPGIYGLRPAARHYFDREPSRLTPRQMVFLVSLIPGPIKYQRSFASGTPTPFFESLMATLLTKLQMVHALSDEEYEAALGAPLDLRVPAPLSPDPGPVDKETPRADRPGGAGPAPDIGDSP